MADPTSPQSTVIGPDTKITGEMSFDGTARILGTFEGKIAAKGELQVASGATCRAAVDAQKVIVDGVVDGNVNARERVELTSKAKMTGDLVATKLVVAEGASFVGHCTVGPDAAKGARPADGQAAGQAPKIEVRPDAAAAIRR